MGKYYIIVIKRGNVELEVIRTTSRKLYSTLMKILEWAHPVSLTCWSSVVPLVGKHYTGREFGKEVLEW